jgi:hypothetical protein
MGSSGLFPLEFQSPISTSNAFQSIHGGLSDGFIARFDAITGVREQIGPNAEWSVFPNPTLNEINLQLPKGGRNWKIEFYDTQGRSVLQSTQQGEFGILDLSLLPVGLYTLNAVNEKHSLSMKIVKSE